MKELSIDIVAYLQGQTQITDIVAERIYAVIGPENVVFPFVTFTINEQTPLTKESDEFDVTLFLWFDENKYDDAMDFTDTVTGIVKNKTNW